VWNYLRSETAGFLGRYVKILPAHHWQAHRPKYVKSLEEKNQLYQSVEQAAIDHWQTFSQAKSKGLAYDQAQELAGEGWIHPAP
jgi:hypothetical protein